MLVAPAGLHLASAAEQPFDRRPVQPQDRRLEDRFGALLVVLSLGPSALDGLTRLDDWLSCLRSARRHESSLHQPAPFAARPAPRGAGHVLCRLTGASGMCASSATRKAVRWSDDGFTAHCTPPGMRLPRPEWMAYLIGFFNASQAELPASIA